MHTLSVHEVGDRDWVVALGVDFHALEDGIGVSRGPNAHVLLAQVLHLRIDGDCLL